MMGCFDNTSTSCGKRLFTDGLLMSHISPATKIQPPFICTHTYQRVTSTTPHSQCTIRTTHQVPRQPAAPALSYKDQSKPYTPQPIPSVNPPKNSLPPRSIRCLNQQTLSWMHTKSLPPSPFSLPGVRVEGRRGFGAVRRQEDRPLATIFEYGAPLIPCGGLRNLSVGTLYIFVHELV
ncbi:hypothetical protein P153DRAFT_128196 [Dothidotthia symphoricarpi CBS 119687]|uniref:Uncharacterized protein n=1 Tax=Dothidotthia symphoricarpi CBS 119687 TaxID=1392245 RepID=A0A6A5ZZU7_9PLEO|nr:uncharacterized protein P153DRAFT_128196 [Dothidotthia symphoricarpi CBS 119687]KAF2124806.1 hypothetical protein P153DRAFT_128196 [Dothidotthia symphoricarpi CBS 119687]